MAKPTEIEGVIKPEYSASAMSLEVALKAYTEGWLRSLQVCFPACVRSYDRETQIAEVVPLVKQGYFNGEWRYKDRTPYKVTVRALQLGGFTVALPIFVGDTGWVFSSDRDTALLKQQGAFTNSVLEKERSLSVINTFYQQRPAQPTLHDFTRGFFIPDSWGIWDVGRFKDSKTINLGNSLYIGSSIGTKDEIPVQDKDEEEKERKPVALGDGLQDGTVYDDSITSSIAIERHGGVHIMSSGSKKEGQSVRKTIERDIIESEFIDENKTNSMLSVLGTEEGLLIKQSSSDNDFQFQANSGSMMMNMVSGGKNAISITFGDKGLNMISTGDISVKSKKPITVNTNYYGGSNSTVVANKVKVDSKRSVSITGSRIEVLSSDDINIYASKSLLLSGSHINIESGKDIELKCGGDVCIWGGGKHIVDTDGEINLIGGSVDILIDNETVQDKQPESPELDTESTGGFISYRYYSSATSYPDPELEKGWFAFYIHTNYTIFNSDFGHDKSDLDDEIVRTGGNIDIVCNNLNLKTDNWIFITPYGEDDNGAPHYELPSLKSMIKVVKASNYGWEIGIVSADKKSVNYVPSAIEWKYYIWAT